MGQRLTVSGELNRIGKAKGNRVRIGRIVAGSRPETERASHGQGEGAVTRTGGPNSHLLKKMEMSCG
jgi:hypothetical protein